MCYIIHNKKCRLGGGGGGGAGWVEKGCPNRVENAFEFYSFFEFSFFKESNVFLCQSVVL